MSGDILATIYDNFGQKLDTFDIVAVSASESGVNMCTLGIYFNTCILMLDINDLKLDKARVIMKRYNLFNTDIYGAIANRQEIEVGLLSGEYKLKSVIKIAEPNEDMMIRRADIIARVKQGKVSSNMSIKFVNSFLREAEAEGRI